jgi:hypothetical protein
MLPEVSITNTTSFGIGASLCAGRGARTRRNVPSGSAPPATDSRWAIAVIATGFAVGRQKRRKSRSGRVPRASHEARAPVGFEAPTSIRCDGDHTLATGESDAIFTSIDACSSGFDEKRSVASG